MQVKVLEIRDEGTFIPALAVDMNPGDAYPKKGKFTFSEDEFKSLFDQHAARMYLLRRCGYPCDGEPNIILTRLDGNGQATNDPYGWKRDARTFPVVHQYIIDHWHELKDGDVVDVSFVLGESKAPKVSERLTAPV